MIRRKALNYSLAPDALKQIEAKMRQMQATGQVITPEHMEAMYSAALKTGAEQNRVQADVAMTGIREEAETNRREEAAKRAKNDRMSEGAGGIVGNLALRYGGKYLDDKLFPKATPGGSVTGEPLRTIGGQEMTQPGINSIGGQPMSHVGTNPTLMPERNPLAGYGTPTDMQALELAPTLPGPVTTPAVAPGALAGPSVETGGAIMPTTELAALQGGVTPSTTGAIGEAASVLPTAELGSTTVLPEAATGIAELASTATPALTPMTALGPLGAGAFGAGIMNMAGVNDDVGKFVMFGQGGEKEQKIAGDVAGGAATGAIAGTYIFPGVGTVIGGVLGGIGGALSGLADDCIIVTCCHGRHSEQVKIAKEYRDRFMSARQIRGYYVLADKLVPLMTRKPKLKNTVRRFLVNRLIPYGGWATGRTTTVPPMTSYVVTTVFLGLCSALGIYVQHYIRRATGEVY